MGMEEEEEREESGEGKRRKDQASRFTFGGWSRRWLDEGVWNGRSWECTKGSVRVRAKYRVIQDTQGWGEGVGEKGKVTVAGNWGDYKKVQVLDRSNIPMILKGVGGWVVDSIVYREGRKKKEEKEIWEERFEVQMLFFLILDTQNICPTAPYAGIMEQLQIW